jgi:hypothetical protein
MEGKVDFTTAVEFSDLGFKIAWGIDKVNGRTPLQDPNFGYWIAEIFFDNDDTISKSIALRHHLCTDQDYDEFYPPKPSDR